MAHMGADKPFKKLFKKMLTPSGGFETLTPHTEIKEQTK
jgi:hypothetical protein